MRSENGDLGRYLGHSQQLSLGDIVKSITLYVTAFVGLSILLTGCNSVRPANSYVGGNTPANPIDMQILQFRKHYEAYPNDPLVAVKYAKILRQARMTSPALAVLERTALRTPKNQQVLLAYGQTLVSAGRYEQASRVLEQAHNPDRLDWKVLSVQGTMAAGRGELEKAKTNLKTALRLQPGQPQLLSNLGMIYIMSGDVSTAELLLRQAAQSKKADIKIRQNYAFVLGLAGKKAEARSIMLKDLRPGDVERNLSWFR